MSLYKDWTIWILMSDKGRISRFNIKQTNDEDEEDSNDGIIR